jgi:phospholipid/cholesterol/gamma-HCH transport system permease protein
MNEVAAPPARGGALRGWFEEQGRAALLAWEIARALPRPRRYLNATIQQAYHMGIRSLPLVLVMATLGGAVVAMQAITQFTGSVPLWVVGTVLAAGVLTELGPVLTGIVLVGRVGASIAAELASMRVSEQIDALLAMGRDPVPTLIVPRVLAGIIVLPPLVIVADAVGILAGWATGLIFIDGLTTADVIHGMRFYFYPFALVYSVLKAMAFGLAITFLSCLIGLEAGGGAEGVGRTTTRAVVATTLAIMILDLLFVPLLKAFSPG